MTKITNSDGFSLMEAMIVIAILAIMSAIAIPNMLSWLANKGLQSATRDLYSNMRKAQSAAVKNNRNCALSFDAAVGYQVYVDNNKNFIHEGTEQLIADVRWSDYRNVQFISATGFVDVAGKPSLAFQPNLLPVVQSVPFATGTVRLQNSIPRQQAIEVSTSGNVSIQ